MITAGPTWVPIDKVRVISNTASGKTGILLAKEFSQSGARVTLLLGQVNAGYSGKNTKLISFKFFDELSLLLKNELKLRRYDVIIHSAAVSDYKPSGRARKKISSGRKGLSLSLKPTPKIIDSLRKAAPKSFLVGFKFEPDLTGNRLINKARILFDRARLDLAVANSTHNERYLAYLVGIEKERGPFLSKENMVKGLVGLIRSI